MSRAHTAGAARMRPAVRLALWLAALGVGVSTVTGGALLLMVRGSIASGLEEDLLRLESRVGPALGSWGRSVTDALQQVERRLRADGSQLEQLLAGGPAAAAVASRLAPATVLTTLELVDEQGTLISAWPEGRTGLVDPRLPGLSDTPRLTRLFTGAGEPAGVRAGREVTVGNRRLTLVGGRSLGRDFLERVSTDDAVLLLSADDTVLANPKAEGLASRARLFVDGGTTGMGDLDAGPDRFRARWRALDERAGEPLGILLVAVDRGPGLRLYARLMRAVGLLVLLTGLLGAVSGLAVARSIARPVEGFVRAVDAIAAGEADYSFPASSRDEFDRLTESFSRLQRALERQQRRSAAAERVAAWSDVARHVAHEVKNPLAPIRLTVQNLRRAREVSPERFDPMFEEGSRTILEEVEQLSRLVSEFSEFARLPAPRPRPTDPEQLLDGVLDLYASESGLRIERRRNGEALPELALDPDQIARALKNVVANALDAMEGLPEKRLEVVSGTEDDMARIEIADCGRGLSEEAARRIFEPDFTTKTGGMGLGMALTYRIVTEHGGVIHAENRDGGGVRVVIHLPLEIR